MQVAEKARIEAEKAEARATAERRRLEAAKREQEEREKARIEAEKAKARADEERRRREAAKRKQEAEKRRSGAGTASGSGGADDGNCERSPPACDKYVRHGEQVQAQVGNAGHGSMTDAALLAAFVARSALGCFKKCLPYFSSGSCKSAFQSAISEIEMMYRSAIESAKGSTADYSYVDEFDRNPGSSRFVRSLGISIAGTSLDSCGD